MIHWKFRLNCAAVHLAVSTLVALSVAALIFLIWYPQPYAQVFAVGNIFTLALLVDVICGPMLTALLANPKKQLRERMADYGLVGGIQLIALLCAMYSVYIVRPIALVFEVDRFVIVSASEVLSDQAQAPDLPMFSRLLLGTREAQADDDLFKSLNMSLAGATRAMRPSWWVPYIQVRSQVQSRMLSVSQLRQARPEKSREIDAAVSHAGLPEDRLWFLPLTTSFNKDWVVLLDDGLQPCAYAPVDGFIK